MKFKIDENLPVEIAELLREASHDAATVQEQSMSGANDPDVIDICKQEQRALITLDLDFADIRSYSPADFFGIIVFRLRRQDKPYLLEMVRRLLPLIEQEELTRRLWIVEENRIRVRGEG